jgi:hypothetical protein
MTYSPIFGKGKICELRSKGRSEKFEEIFRQTPHPGDALRPQLGHHVYRAEALGQP